MRTFNKCSSRSLQVFRIKIHSGSPTIKSSTNLTIVLDIFVAPGVFNKVCIIFIVIVQVFCHPSLKSNGYRLIGLSITTVLDFSIFHFTVQVSALTKIVNTHLAPISITTIAYIGNRRTARIHIGESLLVITLGASGFETIFNRLGQTPTVTIANISFAQVIAVSVCHLNHHAVLLCIAHSNSINFANKHADIFFEIRNRAIHRSQFCTNNSKVGIIFHSPVSHGNLCRRITPTAVIFEIGCKSRQSAGKVSVAQAPLQKNGCSKKLRIIFVASKDAQVFKSMVVARPTESSENFFFGSSLCRRHIFVFATFCKQVNDSLVSQVSQNVDICRITITQINKRLKGQLACALFIGVFIVIIAICLHQCILALERHLSRCVFAQFTCNFPFKSGSSRVQNIV